ETTRVVISDFPEVTESRNDVVHIAFGFDQALAGVQCFGTSEFILARFQLISDLKQEVTAFHGWATSPHTGFKRPTRCQNSTFGIFCGGFRYDTDFAAICRTVNCAAAAVGSWDPLAIDEKSLNCLSGHLGLLLILWRSARQRVLLARSG